MPNTRRPSPRKQKGKTPPKARRPVTNPLKPSPNPLAFTEKAEQAEAAQPQGDEPVKSKHTGRPSDYLPEFDEQVFNYCLLGATDKQIAVFFGVSEVTINAWKTQHPNFLKSMRKGKDEADAIVANALYHRARGYSHPEVHVSNFQGAITLTPLVKHYPPDTAAASLWLRNRQPKQWRDKVDHELSGPDGGPIKSESSVIKLDPAEAYKRMLKKKPK